MKEAKRPHSTAFRPPIEGSASDILLRLSKQDESAAFKGGIVTIQGVGLRRRSSAAIFALFSHFCFGRFQWGGGGSWQQ